MLYRFEDCELDEGLRELRRRGRQVTLQPKVIDLLLFLLRHRGRVVPKEVLFRELWPDAIVTRASLTRLVKEARRALGDDGCAQRIVRTVRGRGYRFASQVAASGAGGYGEEERAIERARASLEAALEVGARDLRERLRAFVETCRLAVHSAHVRHGASG